MQTITEPPQARRRRSVVPQKLPDREKLPGNATTQAAIRDCLEGRTEPTSLEEIGQAIRKAAHAQA